MGPRVIVVGGGIAGAAATFRLAQAGAAVTLIDAGHLGYGASVASFAWLNASNKPPFAYHFLNVSGMNEYNRLRAELGEAPWLHWTGHVEWDGSPDGPRLIQEKVERLRGWGYAAELLPVRDLPRLEPDLVAPPRIEEFAFYPDEGYLDPVLLIAHLVGAARAAGAEVRPHTRVVKLVEETGRIVGVETASGEELRADVVVSCAGRWSDEFLRLAGIELPLAPTIGMIAVTAPAPVRLRGIHHDDLMNIRPDGAGRVVMREHYFDQQVQFGEPVPPQLLAELRDRVATVLPGVDGVPIEAVRVTIRPIPGDQLSAVGPVPGVEGLYVVVSHSAVTLGALFGRLVAEEIVHGRTDTRLADFRPQRLIAPVPA